MSLRFARRRRRQHRRHHAATAAYALHMGAAPFAPSSMGVVGKSSAVDVFATSIGCTLSKLSASTLLTYPFSYSTLVDVDSNPLLVRRMAMLRHDLAEFRISEG